MSGATVTTPQLARVYEDRYPHLRPVRVVRQGFDADLFARVAAGRRTGPGPLNLVYTGTLYSGFREPTPVFEALRLARSRGLDVVLTVAGRMDESVIDLQMVADAHPGAEFHRGELEVSPDGRMLAWSYDVVGDERYGLRFRDLRTGADLPGVIEATFPSGWWSADSTTYLYLRTDPVIRPHQVWAHTLGTDPSADVLVFTEPDERFEVSVDVTRSGAWLVITAVNEPGPTDSSFICSADRSNMADSSDCSSS